MFCRMTPEIEYELGPKTLHEPLFNEDLTVIHLRLEEPINLTKEKSHLSFDITIKNPDGYFGLASVSSLCPVNLWGSVYSCHTSLARPTFTIQLTPWGKVDGPIHMEAGTPVMMYTYYSCDYDDCGHVTCEPRNRLRFEKRWAKMTEEQRLGWKTRHERVSCQYKNENPPPFRDDIDENIAHLRAESDIVIKSPNSALAVFDVEVEVPFGWYVKCMLSEVGGLQQRLESPGYELWLDGSKPLLELKLKDEQQKEFTIPKGTPVCRLEMKKYRCDCPRCHYLQLEPAENQPPHDTTTEHFY